MGIRGVIASASLKLGGTPCQDFSIAGYPRRNCLGLIEAIHGSPQASSMSGIRGVIASASLKRRAARCNGEIHRRIRGVIASASLKPMNARGDRLKKDRIRGVIASASLKRDAADGDLHGLAGVSEA